MTNRWRVDVLTVGANLVATDRIAMKDSGPPKRKRRWYQFRLRTLLLVTVVLCVLFGWVVTPVYRLGRHQAVSHEMETAILRLSMNRPPDVTEDQWAYCITWTFKLHCNYGVLPEYIPTDDLQRIVAGLERRIDDGPDLATIDWVWDQYVQSSPRARNYEYFRPTAPHNRDDFQRGAHHGNSLSSLQSRYQRRVAED